MNELYVPKRIKAGYNERSDTYSGKLAYIIYWDEKGKLRKENSWRSWMEEELGEDDFDNVPTSGFVLNRAVGGVKRSWSRNARMEKVRVFDPRGFEIEIDMDNLLFILQENSSIVGKGLEGEFVYAWEGTKLMLLPTNCKEYQDAELFTSLQGKKLSKADMLEGCSYITNKGKNIIYLGRFDFHQMRYVYWGDRKKYGEDVNEIQHSFKCHVFWNEDFAVIQEPDDEAQEEVWEAYEEQMEGMGSQFHIEKGFTKLAVRKTMEPVANYAELLEAFANNLYGSKVVDFETYDIEVPTFQPLGTRDTQWDRNKIHDRTQYCEYHAKDNVYAIFSYREQWNWRTDKFVGYQKCYHGFYTIKPEIGFVQLRGKDKYKSQINKHFSSDELVGTTMKGVKVVLESGARVDGAKLEDYNYYSF
jgi:hypothetical protein